VRSAQTCRTRCNCWPPRLSTDKSPSIICRPAPALHGNGRRFTLERLSSARPMSATDRTETIDEKAECGQERTLRGADSSVRAGEVRNNVYVAAFVFRLLRVRAERPGPDGLAVVVLLSGEQARWRFAPLHPAFERGERIKSKLRDTGPRLSPAVVEPGDHEQTQEALRRLASAYLLLHRFVVVDRELSPPSSPSAADRCRNRIARRCRIHPGRRRRPCSEGIRHCRAAHTGRRPFRDRSANSGQNGSEPSGTPPG
jgi:hypothetical protein